MNWPWLPRIDGEYAIAEGSKRLFWGFQVPLVAGTAVVFFIPAVRAWTGVRPVPAALLFLLHLVAYGSDVHFDVKAWRPRLFASAMTVINLSVCAAPAGLSGRPTSALWGFYFVYILVAAQAFGPVIFVLLMVVAVPLAIAGLWALGGWVPLPEGLESTALVAAAAAITYVFLARLQRERFRARDEFVDAQQRSAAEQERQRIARELHSTLGASLTELALWSDIASAAPGPQAEQALHRTSETARRALQDLRTSVAGLTGTDLTAGSLESLVRRRVSRLCEAAGVNLDLAVRGPGTAVLASGEAYHVVKLVEEATLNAVRHGHPHRLEVAIQLAAPLAVRVEDDGCGFDPEAAAPGHGLAAIRDHAAALGSVALWQSQPDAGTRLVVERAGTRAH